MQNEILLKQLSERQLVMSKFVHEIRNPLTLVSCELQMLTSLHPEAENWREVYNIQEQLTYIKNLISEFSDYNNAGRLVIKPADMYSFLYNAAESFRPMFEYLNIDFITEISADLPEIPADTLRLRQAITNLLRNAEESISHDHGEIILQASMIPDTPADICTDTHTDILADDSVISSDIQMKQSCNSTPVPLLHISISDNGCGIEPEHLSQLGKPFVTYKENGTGLGLTITRQIIESHGGTIKIESLPSKGTTVHLYLPSSRMI